MTRYLGFSLAKEEYAIELLSIREVIGLPPITSVPHVPAHFLGIMNLRGQVISVVDLRKRFGLPTATTGETAVMILNFPELSIGVVVDSVNSVLNPEPDNLSPTPDLQGSSTSKYITGVYRKNDHLVLLLDIASALDLSSANKSNNAAVQPKAA